MKEVWRSVCGWRTYEASSLGRVRRVGGGRGVRSDPYVMTPSRGRTGYLFVYVCVDGRKHILGVHQAVALAFIGVCPKGKEVSHLDHDKANNVPANLTYMTRLENVRLSVRAGRNARGEQQGAAKLSIDQVKQIRTQRAAGVRLQKIADQYGITTQTVSKIARRTSWSWL